MKAQKGMTLLEVMVALVVFALAGVALLQTMAQQVSGLGRMEENVLASWLADNQQVQLCLENVWPETSWSEKTVTFAGADWYLRWRGVNTENSQQRALDVEVRRSKEDSSALVSLRRYVVRE